MGRMLRRPNFVTLIVIIMVTTSTLWSAFLSKKLTVVQTARILAAFYVPRRTFGIFTAAILWPLTNPVESKMTSTAVLPAIFSWLF